MKLIIMLLTLVTSLAYADDNTQIFAGVAAIEGGPNAGCPGGYPSQADAEADANRQATAFCTELNLKSVQLTPFTYSSNNCVATGPGYRYMSNILYAEAKFGCQ